MPSADNMLLLTMFRTNFIRRLGPTWMHTAGRGPALIVVTEHSDEHDRNP